MSAAVPAASAAPVHAPSPRTIALAGLVSLGVAMGIGRFAFTPLLPAMLAARDVTLAQAAFLASSNYLGYVIGALLCVAPWSRLLPAARGRMQPEHWVRLALVAVCLLTAGMALPAPATWAADRLAAGIASALAFVFTTSWCLGRLARTGHTAMGALIYAGPGLGILVTGAAGGGMLAAGLPAGTGWLAFAALAVVLTALVWRVFTPGPSSTAAPPAPAQAQASSSAAPARGPSAQTTWLALAYGLAGLGYIVTATFLPVIAREALAGSRWSDVFWPLFGVGTTVGAWLASRIRASADARALLAGCYFIQALGIALTLVWPTVAGMALGTALLGLPFTAITFFAMREVRRIEPARTTASIALLTVVYGLGQIAGPPLATWLVHHSASAADGFTLSLWGASGLLALGGLLFLGSRRVFPLRD